MLIVNYDPTDQKHRAPDSHTFNIMAGNLDIPDNNIYNTSNYLSILAFRIAVKKGYIKHTDITFHIYKNFWFNVDQDGRVTSQYLGIPDLLDDMLKQLL